jgi:hypothetical protein
VAVLNWKLLSRRLKAIVGISKRFPSVSVQVCGNFTSSVEIQMKISTNLHRTRQLRQLTIIVFNSPFFTFGCAEQKRLTAIRGMAWAITLSLMRPIWAEKLPRDLFLIRRVYGKFLSFHTRRQSSLPGANSPFGSRNFCY